MEFGKIENIIWDDIPGDYESQFLKFNFSGFILREELPLKIKMNLINNRSIWIDCFN